MYAILFFCLIYWPAPRFIRYATSWLVRAAMWVVGSLHAVSFCCLFVSGLWVGLLAGPCWVGLAGPRLSFRNSAQSQAKPRVCCAQRRKTRRRRLPDRWVFMPGLQVVSSVVLCLVCGFGFLAGPFLGRLLGRLSFRYSAQSQVLRAKRRKTCLRRLADRWVYCCTYYMPTCYARGGCIDSRPLKKLLIIITIYLHKNYVDYITGTAGGNIRTLAPADEVLNRVTSLVTSGTSFVEWWLCPTARSISVNPEKN